MVTGDGTFHVASDKDDADLFWAIRGGGGNFGVVTSFEFRLSPVKDIYGGPMFFEVDQAGDLFRLYREFIADAPEAFGGFPAFQIAPPLPFIPEERHGKTHALFVACWAGDLNQGEKMLQAVPRLRARRGRDGRADALPGAEQRLRRAVPVRAAALLEGELRQGAHRRRDRRARRARPQGAGADLDDAHLPDQRCLPPGGARRRRRSPTATPTSPP